MSDHYTNLSEVGLSPREEECLRLVLALRNSKAIAGRLGIKPDTVDGYLKTAMRKLGAPDRYSAALTLHALEQPGVAPPLFGVPQTTGVSETPAVVATQDQHDGKPNVPSELREKPIAYVAGRPAPLTWWSTLLGPLHRTEGGHNRLSIRHRLGVALNALIAAVFTFFLLTGTLLAFTAAYRELERF